MKKWLCLTIVGLLVGTATISHALERSPFVGTQQVQFQPIQSQGIRKGCTLAFRVIGKDHTYGKGDLVFLRGIIGVMSAEQGNNIIMVLRIGVVDSLDNPKPKPTVPYFAYLQTPHGTTAKNKIGQQDPEPGFRDFYFAHVLGDVVAVYKDIVSGEPVTIGFNREMDGLDVLVPLDLRVAESSLSGDGSIVPRQSDEMLHQFSACSQEVLNQALNK